MGRISLSGHVSLYRDLAGTLGADEAARIGEHQGFQDSPGNVASGFMPGALWLRFALSRPAGAPALWWLEVDGFAERVELFVPRPGGGFERRLAGSEQPFAERAVKYRNSVFPLDLPAAGPQTFYVRIPIEGARRLRLLLWQAEDFQRANLRETLLQGGYFGAVLLLIALNLAYWAWQRAPLYGWYAANVPVIALYFFSFEGYLGVLFDPAPGLPLALARMAISLWPATNAALLSRLLHLERHMPRVDRACLGLFYGLALVGVMAVLTGYYTPLGSFLNLSRLLVVAVSLVLPLLLLRRGVREAATYLLAFGCLLVAGVLITLEQHGLVLVGGHWTSDQLLQAATLPHIIVMHFMVARRFHLIQATQRQAEREAALQRRQQDEQREFLSLLAHEIKNPLAVMDGTAQVMALTGKSDPAHIAQIRGSVARISDLLRNCLVGERVAEVGWHAEMADCDLRQIARAALAGCHSPRHDLHADLESLPERMECDGALMRILLDNLLGNAVKYSPAGGPIELRGRVDDGVVVLEVSDEGVGIAPEEQDRIFRRFYRPRQGADIPGAGLGLYLVRRIAELHGGGVACVSAPGEGTRMTVRLPMA
ncbi:MAG: sensor histidine kinase [Rhodocyclaceae bacterium]|nr:sensor histidine kinase [Rhodocyclaceae bacterium]